MTKLFRLCTGMDFAQKIIEFQLQLSREYLTFIFSISAVGSSDKGVIAMLFSCCDFQWRIMLSEHELLG